MSKPENPELLHTEFYGDGHEAYWCTVTLRDLFAAAAAAGEMAYSGAEASTLETSTVARKAYEIADAMLEARGK